MERWEIYRFQIDYIQEEGSQKRPVIYIHEDETFVYCLLCTTHRSSETVLPRRGEYFLIKWKEAGFEKPTYVKCDRIHKVSKEDYSGKRYGRLQAVDIRNVRTLMRYHGLSL